MASGIGRHGELHQRLIDPSHLMACAVTAARGKRRRPEVARFLLDLEPNCFALAAELREGVWFPGEYRTFMVTEPKPRMISAAPFRDRVVHHALVSLLEPHFERRFVAHSYACRRGKGTHRALMRASALFQRKRFVLKADVAKFFPSIDHEILKAAVRRVIVDDGLVGVLERVIDGSNPQEPVMSWFPGDDLFGPASRRRGLPIGNLTSQFLANVYLDQVDHAIMDRLGFGHYVRYCDDMLVFDDDRDRLWDVRTSLAAELARLRLALHERKGGVHATHAPVPFLGFVLCGGQRRLARAGVVRATRRLRGQGAALSSGLLALSDVSSSIAAWRGHVAHGTSPGLLMRVLIRSGLGVVDSSVIHEEHAASAPARAWAVA